MPAKDCIDAMVRVPSLDDTDFSALVAQRFRSALVAQRFRQRPEHWNHEETLDAATNPKRVFAPPPGARSVNIHFRELGSRNARYSLLFRDYLRDDASSRAAWGQFKIRLAKTATDIYTYGQIKSTVQSLLMMLARQWAEDSAWRP
jgi:GrpB-like predicted nucleotidyltransferase (UPF0157 family)